MISKVIQGAYFHDIMAQAKALDALNVSLSNQKVPSALREQIAGRGYCQVVLTGMGSSLHALYPLYRQFGEMGLHCHWLETSELLLGFEPWYSRDTLLVAVSQSGESAEIVQLMSRANDFGHVIGITNGEHSTLARSAGTTIRLHAGSESTVSCKTYLCTLAALNWLAAQFTTIEECEFHNDLTAASQAVANYLLHWKQHVVDWMPIVEPIHSVFVTGRGNSLATAGTAGLILKESTRQHAEGMSSAAFRHGPLEMAGESVLVVIIEGEANEAILNRRLADDVIRGGGNAVLLRSGTSCSEPLVIPRLSASWRPIVEILPFQMLSFAIAARDGIEAGRFERASKITIVA